MATWTVCWMFHGQLLGQVLLEDYLECLFFVHCSAMPCFAKEVFTSQRNLNQLFFCTNINSSLFCAWHSYGYTILYANFFCLFFWRGKGGVAKDACNFFSGGIWVFVAPQKFFIGCLFLRTSKSHVWFILFFFFFFYFNVSSSFQPDEMFFRMSPSCQIRDLGTYCLFHIYTKI